MCCRASQSVAALMVLFLLFPRSCSLLAGVEEKRAAALARSRPVGNSGFPVALGSYYRQVSITVTVNRDMAPYYTHTTQIPTYLGRRHGLSVPSSFNNCKQLTIHL
ncbi:hypothetical protein GGR50DRAFT_33350 [Xylaria sp. CBS 124048]|nr:hypothetical protein GGR50DRAFT_33350 [Xylaria sp. CBS 124048]